MMFTGCKASEIVTPTQTVVEAPQEDSKEIKLSQEEIQTIISDLNFPEVTASLSQLKDKASILKRLEVIKTTSKQPLINCYYAQTNKTMFLYPTSELPSDYDPTERPWYKETLENTMTVHVSDIYVDAVTNQQILTLSARVMNGKKLEGVVGFDLIVGEAEPVSTMSIDDPNAPKLSKEDIHTIIKTLDLTQFANDLSNLKNRTSILKKLEEKQTNSKQALLYCYYALADKTMLIHPVQELPGDYDPTARPWYMETLEGSDVVHVSDIYLDAILNKYILTLSTPVKKDGKILGVLGVDVIIEEN